MKNSILNLNPFEVGLLHAMLIKHLNDIKDVSAYKSIESIIERLDKIAAEYYEKDMK